jgi:hypothetical protein
VDIDYRQRLLEYIDAVASECLPQNDSGEWMDIDGGAPDVDEELETNRPCTDRVFQPFPDPDDPDFEALMREQVFHIVRVRQFHSRKHTPTCFKYGKKKSCRFRFPRKIVSETAFDEATGVVYVKRNHKYLNGFNKWLSIMTRGNHDIQFLLTKNHALAIVHYIMKYITKPEAALHSKLTVAAAVRKTISTQTVPGSSADISKKLLLKVYNKLDTLREVGVPEAISHILKFPERYTDANFVNLHTTHLLRHMRNLAQYQIMEDDENEDDFNLEVIVNDQGALCTVSLFDDYACRGEALHNWCLYDYCAQFYKHKRMNGLLFDSPHPQREHYSQFLRQSPANVPTLLGKLFFVKPDSLNEKDRRDYHCLIASLFFPWSQKRTPKSSNETWEQFVEAHRENLLPRLRRIIDNLTLLHKTKEDTRLHHLQMQAQQESSDSDDDSGDDSFESGDDHVDADDDDSHHVQFSAAVEQVLSNSIEDGLDFYTSEGLDALRDTAHATTIISEQPPQDLHSFGLSLEDLQTHVKSLSKAAEAARTYRQTDGTGYTISSDDQSPHVFLTDGTSDEPAIMQIVRQFTLNAEQERALRIIAYHTANRSKVGPQLRMGIFGEGGTGKSRLIAAIRAWFSAIGKKYEVVITATTGSAAFNINGSTLHSEAHLNVKKTDKKKIPKKELPLWRTRNYLITDEVSMCDTGMLENLDTNLRHAKSNQDIKFGGVNVIFMGDFLQIPTVSGRDVYLDKLECQKGHQLWRSLNAVVLLTEQMRQSEDPEWGACLRRLRVHLPTDADIAMIIDRVGAPLACPSTIPMLVRRHNLRNVLNEIKLREISQVSEVPITHCLATIHELQKMSLSEAYSLKGGKTKLKGDGILSVIPGAPLLITKNIDRPLGMSDPPNFVFRTEL